MGKFKRIKTKCLSVITALVILLMPLTLPVNAVTTASEAVAANDTPVPTVHVLTHTFGGLSVLLEYNGHFGLIDSGEDKDSPATDSGYWHQGTTGTLSKASEDYSIPYLKKLGVSKEKKNLEFFIGTHPHSDHIGAADEIIREFRPKKVYLQEYSDSYISNKSILWDNRYVYEKTVAAARATGAELIQDLTAQANHEFYLGPDGDTTMKVEIKNYGDDYKYQPTNDANDFSLGVLVTANNKKMFISGDINNFDYNRDEDKLAKELGDIDALVLGHHGHYGSNSYNYVTTLNPELMIIPGSFSNVSEKGLDYDKGLLETLWYMGNEKKSKLFATEWFEKNGYNSLDVYLYSSGVTTNVPSGFEYFAETELSDGIWTGIYYKDGLPHYDETKNFQNEEGVEYDGTSYKNGYYMTGKWVGSSYDPNDANIYKFYKFESNKDNSYVTGWHLIYGRWYYFNSEGKLVSGWNEIDGNKYYLDILLGGAIRTGLFTDTDGKQYYFALDGKMMTGWVTIGKYKYFFHVDETTEHKKGEMAKSTLVGTNQYVNSSGVYEEANWPGDGTVEVGGTQLLKGWLIWNDGYYYIDPETNKYVTGWQTIDNIRYYFKDSQSSTPGFEGGQMVTGPCNIGGKLYYFSTATESRPVNSTNNQLTSIGSKLILGDGGDPWILTKDGKWYYLDYLGDYSLITGWGADDNKYYFDPNTGEMQIGLTEITTTDAQGLEKKNYYYLRRKGDGGSEGSKVTDVGTFSTGYGKSYYVTNTDGVVDTSSKGWTDIEYTDGKTYKYYFYDDHSLAKGLTKIGDEFYYFVNDGEKDTLGQPVGSLVTNPQFIHSTDGNVYYVYGNGTDKDAGGNGYTVGRLFDNTMRANYASEKWDGWLRIGDNDATKEYYCFGDFAVMRTGFFETDNGEGTKRMYYLAKSTDNIPLNDTQNFKEGQMVYNVRFTAYDGNNYFARNSITQGDLLTGVQKDKNDSNYYYFINGDEVSLPNGQPANSADKYKQVTDTGLIKASDGNYYYVSDYSERYLLTGWKNTGTAENPVWRYFYTEKDNENDSNLQVTAMATGIYTPAESKVTYFFSEEDQVINGVTYEKGQMLTCGYFTDSKGNSYYTLTGNKNDGYLKEGWLKLDNGWHYFCSEATANTPKYASVKGETVSLSYNASVTQSYTFNENGVLVDGNGNPISPMGAMPGDLETVINNNGIKLRLFNYSNEINYKSTGNSTVDNARLPVYTDSNLTPNQNTFFAFKDMQNAFPNVVSLVGRKDGYNQEKAAKYDPFQLVPNHLTVKRTLSGNNGYPKLDFTRDAFGNTRTDTSELSLLNGYDLSLEYLFNENVSESNQFAVTSYNPTDTFFQYDENTSRYYYNSVNNAVDYDEIENTCHLRNYVEQTKYMNNAFTPFSHTTGDKKDLAYQDTDYWFGMTMEIEFVQSASGQITVKDSEGNTSKEDMVFNFSGDDDVWVFVDDTLVLDLGGIHNVAEGSINFNTGEIIQKIADGYIDSNYTQSFPTTLSECFEKADTEPNGGWDSDGDTFADFTTHTMKFYYLERGAGRSNCSLSFNMPTVPNKSVVVSKDVYSSKNELANGQDDTAYEFTMTKSNNEPLSIDERTVTEMLSGEAIEVSDDGTFKLKGGEKAVFSNLSPDINYTISETNIRSYVTSTTVNGEQKSSVTVTPSNSVQYVRFRNTLKSLEVTLKYYGRETVNGKPADIKKEPTIYTKSYIGQEYLDYINSENADVKKDPIGAMILKTSVTFDSNSAQQDTKYKNVLDGYEMWISQAQAKVGIASFDNLHQKNEKGTYNKYSETDYHTNWYGYTQTVSAGGKTANWDDSTLTDTVSDGEKWVNYYGYTDGIKQELDEPTKDSEGMADATEVSKVSEVTVWLFNRPQQYTVEAYEAKETGTTFNQVGDKYVVSGGNTKTIQAYYNQRLGLEIGADAEYSKATDHLAGYGIDSYVGTKLETAASIKKNENTTLKFAYWAFDPEGKNIASTDILYNYRIVTNTKLYAVYTSDGKVNNGKPGLTVSENERDIFFNSSGTSITRLNTEMNPYNCQNNDANIKNVAITYIIPNSTNTEIVDVMPETQKSGVTYVLLSKVQEAIKATLKYVRDENTDKNFYSFTYSDTTIELEGFKKGNYFVFYVDGHNIPEDELTGVKDISLTNKNRIEFGSDFQTEALYKSGGKRMYAFAAMYYNGSYTDNNGNTNNLDEWIVSDNFIDYNFTTTSTTAR